MKTPRLSLVLSITLTLASGCSLDVRHEGPGSGNATVPRGEISDVVQAEIDAGRAAGIAVGVSRDGELVYSRGFGKADIENDVEVATDTVFRIGSITKQFTAAAILKLAEEGKLSLDDSLSTYVPDFPTPGHTVTITQLLNHTSGIKSYTGQPQFWELSRNDLTHEQLLELVRDQPFDFEPGEKWSYNNTGYYLLGMVIENVSGLGYADYLQTTFFEPLGLRSTTYCDEQKLIPRRAEGYERDGDTLVNDTPLSMSPPFAAGALCSTVEDLLAWQRALATGKVVSEDSYRAMITPLPLNDGTPQRYGFGLATGQLESHASVSHGGGINGFVSMLAAYPDDDLAVAVLVNTGGPLADLLADEVARLSLGLEIPDVADLPIGEQEVEGLLGTYDLGPVKLTVTWRDDHLWVRAEGQEAERLKHQGDFVFISDFDYRVRVEFALVDGRASELILFQGQERRAPRVE